MTAPRGRTSQAPRQLWWDQSIPIAYATIDGQRLRYIRTGRGPHLVLLHTLRTSLDIFERLIPRLQARWTIWALDYPGHGWSDIPEADYGPELFVRAVAGFLDHADLREATLAGISIGGTIPLLLSATHDTRISKVVAINPYDYAKGLGITRGNVTARMVVGLSRIPGVGEVVMRLRTPTLERWVMEGGVADPAALSTGFLQQIWKAGQRPGHDRAFLNLIRHAALWEDAHQVYPHIRVPVLVIYGERDWSRPRERQRVLTAIPGARLETVTGGGHFLSLDQPERLAELIDGFGR